MVWKMNENERLAYDAAMSAWEQSLKRPDLQEQHRVSYALQEFMRMCCAIKIAEEVKSELF